MIKQFNGDYRFLSNFYACKVILDGETYQSVENAYQAAKYPVINRAQFKDCSPSRAKQLGQMVTLPTDWNSKRLIVMHDLVKQKFSNNEYMKQLLLSTGDQELVEGNTWGDTFWGVYKGKGENHLGKILMKVRKEISDNN